MDVTIFEKKNQFADLFPVKSKDFLYPYETRNRYCKIILKSVVHFAIFIFLSYLI